MAVSPPTAAQGVGASDGAGVGGGTGGVGDSVGGGAGGVGDSVNAAPRATDDKRAALAENWLFLPWGEAVGRVDGQEADSEGPKSFAVTPDGGVLLLDQVNLRVLDIGPGGALLGIIPLPASTFDDVEQYRGEAVLVLDRLAAQSLLVLDWQGSPLAEVPLRGRGIARPGRVTALLPRSDGIWLEVAHRHSVKVLDRWLIPCERQILLGRPAEGGLALHGALDGRDGARISVQARNHRPTVTGAGARGSGSGSAAGSGSASITGVHPYRRIVWLDEDPQGRVVAVLHEARFDQASPFRVIEEGYDLVLLEPRDPGGTGGTSGTSGPGAPLKERDRLHSPWVLTQYDQRVELRVGPEGRLWQMAFAAEGVLFLRWDWRRP
jgi:hypothetical protein